MNLEFPLFDNIYAKLDANESNERGLLAELPPELVELIMTNMNARYVLPFMLSASVPNALGQHESLWEGLYQAQMPDTHHALSVASNTELWRYNAASSRRFIYEFSKIQEEKDLKSELPCVLSTLKGNLQSLHIVQAGIYILRRLAYYPPSCDKIYRERVRSYRAVLGSQGAVETLLNIVHQYRGNPEVLSGALCAIGNIAIDADNSKRLVSANGIPLIMNTLRFHQQNSDVVDYGCFALCNIADDHAAKAVILAEGAVDFGMSVLMGAAQSSEKIPPLDLLSVLLQDQDVKITRGAAVLELLKTLMVTAEMDRNLWIHLLTVTIIACEACDENRNAAVALGIDSLVEQKLRDATCDAAMFTKATLCLFTLFWQHADEGMDERRQELIRSICNGMRQFPNEISLQRTSAAMLSDFAHSDAPLKRLILELGGQFLVRTALSMKSNAPFSDSDVEWAFLAQHINIE